MSDQTPADRPVLGLVIASTRPGRIGAPIADWLSDAIEARDDVEVRVLDLAEVNLPMFDEPNHPRTGKYVHEHKLVWSAMVAACDAFVVVTPEYNSLPPAPLINAFDYLSAEWQDKPLGIVSYGGVSAGLRAASHLKEFFQALQLLVVQPAVSIPFAMMNIADGVFTPSDQTRAAVDPMLEAILARHRVLAPLRER